ncbi:hypothetical protein B0H10DRAFT_2240067 [Mycena sp. CBHHK59/15]|nr:hypothetical protein B0H10DRAFT_2240067 [Mycena sp. CBHHK59/15]
MRNRATYPAADSSIPTYNIVHNTQCTARSRSPKSARGTSARPGTRSAIAFTTASSSSASAKKERAWDRGKDGEKHAEKDKDKRYQPYGTRGRERGGSSRYVSLWRLIDIIRESDPGPAMLPAAKVPSSKFNSQPSPDTANGSTLTGPDTLTGS